MTGLKSRRRRDANVGLNKNQKTALELENANRYPPGGQIPYQDHGCIESFPVDEYDLDSTLTSGQAFRWRRFDEAWQGVIGSRWVRLKATGGAIIAQTATPCSDWSWLKNYLQLDLLLGDVLATFPQDEPTQAAVNACRGLRLLRQEPWECLASFVLSSTKQILQIQQIVDLLCQRYGQPIEVPSGHPPTYAFPSSRRLAELSEAELRACKMGFRAAYLSEISRAIAREEFDLARLYTLPAADARAELMQLPGVGRKIADCVLLFSYGFQNAFPVDVWIMKALRQLYFPRRAIKLQRLHRFTARHFGPNAGYAQQYLFHYMRIVQGPKSKRDSQKPKRQRQGAALVGTST
jgi:N-glycosylase/DNA lyase